jgi:hypothetical protein
VRRPRMRASAPTCWCRCRHPMISPVCTSRSSPCADLLAEALVSPHLDDRLVRWRHPGSPVHLHGRTARPASSRITRDRLHDAGSGALAD